jgi:hypothetical protein
MKRSWGNSFSMQSFDMLVIYEHPIDAPDHYVVRRWIIQDGKMTPDHGSHFNTLGDARAFIPPGRVKIPRSPNDDRAIVESWI